MHQKAGNHAVAYTGAARPSRPCDGDDDRHQRDHHGHADREIGQRLGISQHIFGGDKAGAPEHHKDRRRRARGKIFKALIHRPP